MHGVLDTFREFWSRLNTLALASCGNCGAIGSGKERVRLEPGLARLFVLRPLREGDEEAIRATQRGARLLHEGRIEESLRELHDAKRLVQRDHVARTNLAAAYFERGDEESALHWMREAHRLAPHDETATLATALLEQRTGNIADAQWLLVNFLQEVDASHIGALRQLGRVHQQQGQWSQAVGCYRRLLLAEPGNPEWQRELEYCMERAPGAAAAMPSEANQAFGGGGVQGNRGYGGSSGGIGSTSGGAAYGGSGPGYSGGYNAGPPPAGDPPPAGGGWGAGGACSGGEGRGNWGSTPHGGGGPQNLHGGSGIVPTAASGLREAARLKETGRTEAALAAYRSVLRADADNAEALGGVADCLRELGQIDRAIEAGKQLLSLRPDDVEANLRVGELLLAAGQPAYLAEPYLQRAASAQPTDRGLRSRLHCATAEAALATEDYKKAVSSASAAVREDASEPRALILLADARIRVADYESALRSLSAALEALAGRQGAEATRRRAAAHTLSAQAQERLRHYPQALEEAQRALDADPRFSAARVVRATALQQSGRDREAHAELQEVLARDPQHVAARLQLGYLQLSANDHRAVATLESAVSSTSASRSALGAAKVYLSLALDSEDRYGSLGSTMAVGSGPGRQGQRAEQVLREGLSLHKNLQCVWRELERGGCDRPLAAMQRLRGICDLDLTTQQAKQLLQLLARASGRSDLLGGNFSGISTPHEGTSRPSSVSMPPSRMAFAGFGDGATPSTSAGTPVQRMCSGSPLQQYGQQQGGSAPHSEVASPWLGETRAIGPGSVGGRGSIGPSSPRGIETNLPSAPPPSWAHSGVMPAKPQTGTTAGPAHASLGATVGAGASGYASAAPNLGAGRARPGSMQLPPGGGSCGGNRGGYGAGGSLGGVPPGRLGGHGGTAMAGGSMGLPPGSAAGSRPRSPNISGLSAAPPGYSRGGQGGGGPGFGQGMTPHPLGQTSAVPRSQQPHW